MRSRRVLATGRHGVHVSLWWWSFGQKIQLRVMPNGGFDGDGNRHGMVRVLVSVLDVRRDGWIEETVA